jgi:hypothetical protein
MDTFNGRAHRAYVLPDHTTEKGKRGVVLQLTFRRGFLRNRLLKGAESGPQHHEYSGYFIAPTWPVLTR